MRLAALDVGTNTVLLLVAECSDSKQVRPIKELSRITRLGRGIDEKGRLDPDAAEYTSRTIKEFVNEAREAGAQKILTAATAALRDAQDGMDFVAKVRREAGVDLDIISGQDEAYLSYLASVRGLNLDPKSEFLIIDIGGGSTELIAANSDKPLKLASLPLGSVRLTERLINHDPPTEGEILNLEQVIEEELRGLGWKISPTFAVGVAGTVTTLGSIALKLERHCNAYYNKPLGVTTPGSIAPKLEKYDHSAVHGLELSYEMVREIVSQLRRLNLEQRKALPGMVEGRADVIIAGATILERILTYFAVRRLLVSDQGVRWGLIWRELERLDSAGCPH